MWRQVCCGVAQQTDSRVCKDAFDGRPIHRVRHSKPRTRDLFGLLFAEPRRSNALLLASCRRYLRRCGIQQRARREHHGKDSPIPRRSPPRDRAIRKGVRTNGTHRGRRAPPQICRQLPRVQTNACRVRRRALRWRRGQSEGISRHTPRRISKLRPQRVGRYASIRISKQQRDVGRREINTQSKKVWRVFGF